MDEVNIHTRRQEIVIAGAGIAGTACAIRLLALGYRVTLLGMRRKLCEAVEAIPERVANLFCDLGVNDCLRRTGAVRVWGFEIYRDDETPPVWKEGWYWHYERTRLARVLLEDAIKRGAKICWLERALPLGTQRAAAWVDASGRTAAWSQPVRRQTREVADLYEGPGETALRPGRFILLQDGWAYSISGREHTTIGLVGPHRTPLRKASKEILRRLAIENKQVRFVGRWPAFPQSCVEPVRQERVSVGDAAVAFSPLAGHGVKFALTSAHGAAAVIHTMLQRPENADIARDYYTQMCGQARRRHLESLAAGREDAQPRVTELPALVRFAAHSSIHGVLRGSFIVPARVYELQDGSRVRWLGDFDLHILENITRNPATIKALLTSLEALGYARRRAMQLVEWCWRKGVLSAVC